MVLTDFRIEFLSDNSHRQSRTLIRKELAHLKLSELEDLNSHLLKFEFLIRELKDAGGKPSEADLVAQLFVTLPVSYEAVVRTLENQSSTWRSVKTKHRNDKELESNNDAVFKKKSKPKLQGKYNGKCIFNSYI